MNEVMCWFYKYHVQQTQYRREGNKVRWADYKYGWGHANYFYPDLDSFHSFICKYCIGE